MRKINRRDVKQYTSKKPKNTAEAECYEKLTENGWEVSHRGWPDFFCTKDGKLCFVEVKKGSTHDLGKYQRAVVTELSKFIPCYLWTPDGGFKKITSDTYENVSRAHANNI